MPQPASTLAVKPHPDRLTPRPAPPRDPQSGSVPAGWTILGRHRLFADGPAQGCLAIAHPAVGLALLDIAPHATPNAELRLRQALDGVAFGNRYPGHLPVWHDQVAPADLARLRTTLAEAFAHQPGLTVTGADAWVAAAGAALAATPDWDIPGRPDSARPLPRMTPHRRAPPRRLALFGLTGGAALGIVLALALSPSRATDPPAPLARPTRTAETARAPRGAPPTQEQLVALSRPAPPDPLDTPSFPPDGTARAEPAAALAEPTTASAASDGAGAAAVTAPAEEPLEPTPNAAPATAPLQHTPAWPAETTEAYAAPAAPAALTAHAASGAAEPVPPPPAARVSEPIPNPPTAPMRALPADGPTLPAQDTESVDRLPPSEESTAPRTTEPAAPAPQVIASPPTVPPQVALAEMPPAPVHRLVEANVASPADVPVAAPGPTSQFAARSGVSMESLPPIAEAPPAATPLAPRSDAFAPHFLKPMPEPTSLATREADAPPLRQPTRARTPTPASAPAAPRAVTLDRRCSDAQFRFQLGEPLTSADRTFLREGCATTTPARRAAK